MNLDQINQAVQSVTSLIQMLRSFGPLLVEMIQTAESMLPQSGTGAQKLGMVQSWIQTAMTDVGIASDEVTKVWPQFSAAISAIVTAYNAIGIFKKS